MAVTKWHSKTVMNHPSVNSTDEESKSEQIFKFRLPIPEGLPKILPYPFTFTINVMITQRCTS